MTWFYEDFKDLSRRTPSNKGESFNIAKNPKYDGYQHGLASLVYNFFDKKSSGNVKSEITSNQELAGELYKPIIQKFKI